MCIHYHVSVEMQKQPDMGVYVSIAGRRRLLAPWWNHEKSQIVQLSIGARISPVIWQRVSG